MKFLVSKSYQTNQCKRQPFKEPTIDIIKAFIETCFTTKKCRNKSYNAEDVRKVVISENQKLKTTTKYTHTRMEDNELFFLSS